MVVMRRKSGLGLGRDVSLRESEGLLLWSVALVRLRFTKVSEYGHPTRVSFTLFYGVWAKKGLLFLPSFILPSYSVQSPLFLNHRKAVIRLRRSSPVFSWLYLLLII